MKRKSCLVMGYINNNLGDDLFFKILFERYKNVDFSFYPPSLLLRKYKKIYSKNKNVKFYDKDKYYKMKKRAIGDKNIPINLFPMICARAEKVDFYINIGGSNFIQNDNWKNDDRFTIKKHLGNKPPFIIGCNFGPGNKEYEDYYKKEFKKFTDICFRDEESYNKFKSLKNTRLSDDIVLLLKENNIQKEKSVAISVVDLDIRKDLKKKKYNYQKYISKNISKLLSENYKIKMFSFCENDGDTKAINEILGMLSFDEKKKIKVINYKDNINAFLKEWQTCEYVIGSRFHSIILALANNQKFHAVSYSRKIENYIKQYDNNIKILNIKDIKVNNNDIEFYELKRKYNPEKQFLKIDEFLQKQ